MKKTKCEKCHKEIKVLLSHFFIRKILRLKDFDLLCTECYFEEAEE